MDFVTANDHAKSAIIAYNYVDRVDASEALSPDSYERFHTRKPSRSVKEQRPGFIGLEKRVDTG